MVTAVVTQAIEKSVIKRKKTYLAWAVCFPITDCVIFSGELFFYPPKNYSFMHTSLRTASWQFKFSRVSSQGLKRGNK